MSDVYKSLQCLCGKKLKLVDFQIGEEFVCPFCQRKHILSNDDKIDDEPIEDTYILVKRPSPTPSETSFLNPGDRLGAYKIVSKIGKGGMGVVYKAYDESLEREVAIKVISSELSSQKEFIERFKREAKSAAALSHPNIIYIHSIGETNDKHYFTMEYVEGKSLEDVLEEKGKIPLNEAINYILQAATGLNAASKKGIIHRDIKPSNLLITSAGLIKIADFGLAKLIRLDKSLPTLTNSGIAIGTPIYMAPEQAKGDEIDHRVDIYSLGATFYHLVTGRTPFEGDTPLKVMLKHITDPLVEPSKVNSEIPPAISQIICQMMAKDPAKRYKTYEELIDALEKPREKPLTYVSLLPRLIAIFVDVVIWAIPSSILSSLLGLIWRNPALSGTLPLLVFAIIYFLYSLKKLSSSGQSYGMRLFHIQVISDKGGLLNVYQITVRFVLNVLLVGLFFIMHSSFPRFGLVVSILSLMGIGIAFFNRRHKTLADIISKSVVVYKI